MGERLALLGGPRAVRHPEALAAATAWACYSQDQREAVLAALESTERNPALLYEENYALERDFIAFTGAKYALAHNNGTSTIHSAYFAVGVQPGDEVLTSAHTWSFQVSQILALHGIPVFCDVDPQTGCIDPDDLEDKITPRTRAVAVVHCYGAVAPMDEVIAVARRHHLAVIEDCSHAHGATYQGRAVGTIGDVGCYSLNASKLVSGLECGVMITNDEAYYNRACVLGHYERLPALPPEYRKYNDPAREMAPTSFGFKYRANPLGSALARAQLRTYPQRLAAQRRHMRALTGALEGLSPAFLPPAETPGTERVWLNYVGRYFPEHAAGVSRQRFIAALRAEGIPATPGRAGYLPIYWNPIYEERAVWAPGVPFDAPYTSRRVEYPRGLCPKAEALWPRQVGLPVVRHDCDPVVIEEVVEGVRKVLDGIEQLAAHDTGAAEAAPGRGATAVSGR
jgi:dTDP-4-amino-4,6-dideoxygalactose transaminase